MKLLDANTLIDKVKIENMLLLNKVKNLELELSVAREKINRSTSSKLDHMLSVSGNIQVVLVVLLSTLATDRW